ncbi:unnamed protein product [Hyaloperonospora brassicae]|uniref:FYVE-type domain-containing protein n=1 Tax=Hyaloperonospora brassicae TaxID=162125 RepID=A0AAV0TNV2_HYABA|nr:unnamed protein product [Hyaloperonospora brassicae]
MLATEVAATDDDNSHCLHVSKQPLTPRAAYLSAAPEQSTGSSTSHSSDGSFHSDRLATDEPSDVTFDAPLSSPLVPHDELPLQLRSSSRSFDAPLDLPLLHPTRDSTSFRDSLMPRNGFGESNNNNSAGGRPTELGNALMRLDDHYRRAHLTSARLSASTSTTSKTASHGLPPLLEAAKAGDIVLVNALVIQAGTDLLRRDPVFGQTALHFAIRGGHLNVVQALLMPQLRDSIVNIADTRRNTALHLAAAKSRRMTRVLLAAGADVHGLNLRNQTALGVHLLTATRDDPTMTELLLQHKASANAPVDQSTMLHVALDKGLLEIALRLVRYGARLDQKDEAGKTVFDKVGVAQLRTLVAQVAHAPTWVADKDRLECMACRKTFGALATRRHHCRLCGRVLCAGCSSAHVRVEQLPFAVNSGRRGTKKGKAAKASTRARTCFMCYDICMDRAVVPSVDEGRGGPEAERERAELTKRA